MFNRATASRSRQRLSLVTSKPWSRNRTESAGLEIRQVRSNEQKEDLYRFRRAVCVADSSRHQLHADQRLKRCKDDLDADGVNLIAMRQTRLLGAIRVNFASTSDLGIFADFYRMREFAGSDHPARTCIVSRLAVDPTLRSATVSHHLCVAAYKHALDAGKRMAFLSANDDFIYYYSALGFKSYMGRSLHREDGQVLPMKLDLLDEKYLMLIGSPLLPTLRAWKQSRQPSVEIRPA